ncbi:glucosaminidase domain-containing protein [Maribacter sp. PR1]|uniref:Peptidoglycan hydrolase n=1 Tax=Maribacter cobaltidurans TaxID=1178778 RepID=A0ABU7IZW0_9FLAO|nr:MULTISPECIES: glucosaminidase domain-containing protein [Maribacter]MDC6391135.1 glucosaminidase domain-containing protein [Maribacter sp. PR1]MEE1978527.1 glucosaminidase domain-containing protein [Maribacter cobaltidurans]
MKKKIVLLLFLGIAAVGCKSKKAYSDKLRTKNVLTESKRGASKASGNQRDTSMPEDAGKFVKFRIETISEYINTFSEVAQMEMKAYGIPASITLAQGLLESGYGQGELALKTNNHFGIKCHTGWQGDYDFHDDDAKGECFRKYNHPMYSFRDHSIFLTTRSRYAFLFDYKTTDYKRWAHGLRKAGYATDRRYPQKLIYLIEKHQLYKYDGGVLDAGYDGDTIVATETDAVHIVKRGDTLYSLSRRYYVSVDELMRMNNLRDSGLSVGQKLLVKSTSINK